MNVKDLISKAIDFLDKADNDEAIEITDQILNCEIDLNLFKEQLIPLLFKGGGYLNDEYVIEYKKAAQYFKKIIELDPNHSKAHYNLGIAYFNLGKTGKALQSCMEAVRINPKYSHCFYNIGLIYEAEDNFEKAIFYYEKAIQIDNHFQYALQAREFARKQLDSMKAQGIVSEKTPPDIKKLKSLFKVSKQLNIQMIQDLLNVDREKLLDIIIDWCEQFQFEIDGDFLSINKQRLQKFILYLDNAKF